MRIKQFEWDVVDSNSWLIENDKYGLLIDAIDNQKLFDELLRLDSLTIILTHSHFDHIIGLNRIRELKPDVTVISTQKCSEYIGSIYRNMSSVATTFLAFYNGGNDRVIEPFVCDPADEVFTDKLIFDWCGYKVELSAFHGHSEDSLIAVIDGRIIFSGDTLLPIPTVTRFPSGSTTSFWKEDMPRLKEIDGELLVYPGHGEPGKLRNMISVNMEQERCCKR